MAIRESRIIAPAASGTAGGREVARAGRTRFQGVWQILRFNWPMYAAGTVILTVVIAGALILPLPPLLRLLAFATAGVGAFWVIASLGVSYYVYDLSPLYSAAWLPRALRGVPANYANLHVGLDEFSDALAWLLPHSRGLVLDFFEGDEMTEPSIARARRQPPRQPPAIPANFRALPLPNDELDAAFLIFAAHELRAPERRTELFRELRRVLKPRGQILVVEHLRDFANFVAFGPGFFHFHARMDWLRNFRTAGLRVSTEFKLTPFVRIFVAEKNDV